MTQTRQRVYDVLNRLYQDIGAIASGADAEITTYAYDANGNLTSVIDPLSHGTLNGYDALNRLIATTDPNSGLTQLGYNGQDKLTQVTDPCSLATSYSVDGLGNLTQQVSPDTGTTQATFDPAGNVLTRTDARGKTGTYTYDALNRLTAISYGSNNPANVSFTYDAGANGIGRLTGMNYFAGRTVPLGPIELNLHRKTPFGTRFFYKKPHPPRFAWSLLKDRRAACTALLSCARPVGKNAGRDGRPGSPRHSCIISSIISKQATCLRHKEESAQWFESKWQCGY